nr:glycoside hydrolase family 13 protein [uncultured Chryseobacterium sp.]
MLEKSIQKELVYISADKNIEKVHIGVFPVKGRYFRKEMKNRGQGYFQVALDLPKGKSFYHYFINGNFQNPVNNNLNVISEHDTHKRSPLVLETEMFGPVKFENNETFINHIEDDIWEFRVISYQQWIENISLLINEQEYGLKKHFTHKNKSFWHARVQLECPEINYYLKISNERQTCYLHENSRLERQLNPDNRMIYDLSGPIKQKSEKPHMSAGYQIFPDRFLNLETPETLHPLKEWGDTPDFVNSFGGTFKGIADKLDYIADMGFEFVYLNPIVYSRSSHRYDCIDYLKIDPLLGSENDFENLVKKIHGHGMKIMLDISLNHCSTDFFAFKDVVQNEENSKYLDWFEVEKFPLYSEERCFYSCWHGYQELPQFNFLNPEVTDYFTQVARFWTERFSIDGWRLDVCTEMPEEFVKKFTEATRKVNSNAVIIAESWDSNMNIFSPDTGVDGLTNFSLYLEAITPFFINGNMSLKEFASTILDMNYKNSIKMNQYSWNFLSNHDISRFQSLIKNKEQYILAFTLLYALPGTPVIYYGEEKRMEGLGDPQNRRCMEFDNETKDSENIYDHLRQLNQFKAKHKDIFYYGDLTFEMVDNEKKLMIIQRSHHNERLIFYFNFDNVSHSFIHSSNKIELAPCSSKLVHCDK